MFNNKEYQKGISLIISFVVMTVVLSVVLSLSTVLFSRVNVVNSMGNTVSSLYAAEGGIEKTLYYDRKEIPKIGGQDAVRGLCNICNDCSDCNNCTMTPVAADGC